MSDGDPIVVRPGAKINLSLEVLGRRADGFHDLATVFQAIDLTDELAISPADEIAVACDRSDLAGEANLAHRAARLLREESGVCLGARIRLTKGVPVAAGLGGGSADAAGALVGCTRLWRLDWPAARLVELAARLGSDCAFFAAALAPFFLPADPRPRGVTAFGGTSLAEGRGERLTPLASLAPHRVLVVRPRLGAPPPADKTRRLYAALRPTDHRDGAATHALVAAIAAGRRLDPDLLVNSFERAAEAVFPEIAPTRSAVLAAGADWVRLAGSGPCLYALSPERDSARIAAIAAALRAAGEEAYVCRTGLPEQVD